MSSPATLTAYAAVGTAAVGVYSAYQQGKEADRAYERQMAQFRDSFRAATTNAEWARVDAAAQFQIDKTYRQDMFDLGVEAAWDAFFTEEDKNTQLRDLEVSINNLTNTANLDKLVADAKTDITRINDQAKLDADYALAMAKYSNDYTAIKAATDAAAKAQLTQDAVMFLDQDINTIKEQLNMAKEALRAGKADAIGKELLATAASLGMGASTSRRLMSTSNKADYLMQQKILESDNAIDKAISQQKSLARKMGTEQQNIYNTATAQIFKNTQEANETSRRIINTANVATTAVTAKLAAAKDYANAVNDAANKSVKDAFDINNQAAKDTIANEIDKAQSSLDAENAKSQSTLDQVNYQSVRGQLVSFSEEFEGTDMSAERLGDYAKFVADNTDLIEQLRNDPTFNWIKNEDKMNEAVANLEEA